jgi:dephospho-CoA kinase
MAGLGLTPKGSRLTIGLTGGIGSGKSTVSKMLVDLGAHLVDMDAISRSLTAPVAPPLTPLPNTLDRS